MRRLLLALACAILFAFGCGEGDHVEWSARIDATQSSGGGTGGASIAASGTFLTLGDVAWAVELPAPFAGELPPADLGAIGLALLHAAPDRRVRDAAATPLGPVALLVDPAGGVELALLAPDGIRAAPVPGAAQRVLFDGETPFRVQVVLAEGLSAPATLVAAD